MNNSKLIFSSGVANTFEWYDYVLFGHFASIIGEKFFPHEDASISLLNAFLVFAVGYLMRPIGGIFFGVIGDKLGRRVALSASIMCMAIPTALIGLLPTYDDIGFTATILMIVARMLQGLSMGGALTGSVSFVIEHVEPRNRGVAGSISMSSICIGIMLGSLVSYAVRANLTEEQFLDFGWRMPFLLGILIVFAGFYIRKNMDETPLFEKLRDEGKVEQSPLQEVISKHWLDMFVSIFINSTGSVIFYLQAIFLMTFLRADRGFAADDVSNILHVSYVVMAVVTVLAGWLSDFIGRRKIYVINLICIAASSFYIIGHFETGSINSVMWASIMMSIFAAVYIGPEPALQAEFYPTNVRNTALSVSYNIATSVFGGTTPWVLTYLVQQTGSINSCAYYVVGCALMSIIALCFYKDRSKIQ